MATFCHISSRCHDGLLFLAKLAKHRGSKPLTIEAAAGQVISPGYLEQIVTPLRAAGLVEGKRGPGGGYRLARDPRDISVREAVEALEGPIALVDCQTGGCSASRHCGSMAIWNTLQERIGATLESMTLADILDQEKR